jgi:hypothetical protein
MSQFLTDVLHAGLTAAAAFGITFLVLYFVHLHLVPAWDVAWVIGLGTFTRRLVG